MLKAEVMTKWLGEYVIDDFNDLIYLFQNQHLSLTSFALLSCVSSSHCPRLQICCSRYTAKNTLIPFVSVVGGSDVRAGKHPS